MHSQCRYVVGMLSGPLNSTHTNGHSASANIASTGSMSGVVVGTGLPHLASNIPKAEAGVGTEKQDGAVAANSAASSTSSASASANTSASASASGVIDIRRPSSSTTTSSSSSLITIQGSKLFLRLLSHAGDADESKVSTTTSIQHVATWLTSNAISIF